MFRHLIGIMLLFSVVNVSAQNNFTGRVVAVNDGNTLRVIDMDNDTITVILKGIDCPEISQSQGKEAQRFTEKLSLNTDMHITLLGRDRWGNDIASVCTLEGEDLSKQLLLAGLAWYSQKNKGEEIFAKLEADSREQGIGIWQEDEPLAPWIFRRQQSMLEPKANY